MSTFLSIVLSSLLAFFPLGGGVSAPNLGAAVPTTPALISTYLAANMTATDSSMTLANGTTRAGTALSGSICFVIDVNTPTVEYVCGTASSTSITGLSRGIDVLNPNSTSSALAYAHRRFASVDVTDYPTLQFLVRKVNGTDPLSGILTYDPSITNAQVAASNQNLVNYGTLASTSIAGAVNADTANKGIVQIASTSNIGTGVALGDTGATLVVPNSRFNTTSTATTTVPVTDANGILSPGFIPTSTPYNWSGAHSFGTTSTFSAVNIQGVSSTIGSSNLNITSATTTFSNAPIISPTSTPTAGGQVLSKSGLDYFYDRRNILTEKQVANATTTKYTEFATSTSFGAGGTTDFFRIHYLAQSIAGSAGGAVGLLLNGSLIATTSITGSQWSGDMFIQASSSVSSQNIIWNSYDGSTLTATQITTGIDLTSQAQFTFQFKPTNTGVTIRLLQFLIEKIVPNSTF